MKRLWVIIGLVFVAVLIVATLVSIRRVPFEPVCDGRTLTSWLDELSHQPVTAETAATVAIRKMGTNAVPFLIEMLHAKDSRFKVEYMDVLERQHLINFHVRYDFQKRSEALKGLAVLGPDAKPAVPEVTRLLGTGESTMAAYTLYRIGSNAVPALNHTLAGTNKEGRMRAALTLGILHDPSSVTNLLVALKDPDRMTRNSAAIALRRFPGQAEIIVPALSDCLDDPDATVQANVVRTLGAFGAEATPAFPKILKTVASLVNNVSEAATKALMQINLDATLAALTNNLESADVNVRRTSARAFYYFKSAGAPAIPLLVKCLKDPDATVRLNAAVALREIGEDPDLVVPALIENLSDPDKEVRVVTAIALGRFGERAKAAVPLIVKIIEENQGDDFTEEPLHEALAAIDADAAAKLSGK